MNKLYITLCITLMFITSLAAAQFEKARPKIAFNPRSYICYRAEKPVQMDGKLDDDGWLNTLWTEEFVDIEGELKPEPYFRTRAKMLWDDEYMYFAAELEETDIWATLTERDSVIYHDNDFEVFQQNRIFLTIQDNYGIVIIAKGC